MPNAKNKDKLEKCLKKKQKGFTLVELIVVITILAILGTIAFISFQNYTKNSRDGVRIADINSVKKTLELFITDKGFYPAADNGTNITYIGAIAWTQGTVGDNVMTNLARISKKPTDPLTGNEYTYSLANNKVEYQLGAMLEGEGMLSLNHSPLIGIANAASSKKAIALVTGTYNEKIIKVSSGATDYILAIPSIINASLSDTDLQNIITKKELVYNNYQNLPDSYKNKGYTMTGGFEFIPGNIVVYSGSKDVPLRDNADKLTFITNLKNAYNGTILQGEGTYIDIINTDTTNNENGAIALVDTYITNHIGGIIGEVSQNNIDPLITKVINFDNEGDYIQQDTNGTKFLTGVCMLETPITASIINTSKILPGGTGYSITNSSTITTTFVNSNTIEIIYSSPVNITSILQGSSCGLGGGSTPMSGANSFEYWNGTSRVTSVYNTTASYGFGVFSGLNLNISTTKIKLRSMTNSNGGFWCIPFSILGNNGASYYVTTNDNSQINTTGMTGINSILFNSTEPTNTSLKYLVSFDGRTTWKYWNGTSWVSTSLSNIKTIGMTKSTLQGLDISKWGASGGFQSGITTKLDFAVNLETTGSDTPELDEIKVQFTNEVINLITQTSPTALSLVHSPRAKTFTFSWTAGTNNGGSCKLQYYKDGATWTDISATPYNCDTTLTNQSVTLPGDGWNGFWSSIQVRIIRTSDSVELGTFDQNLTCSAINGSATSTPNIDEDCNGTWDNISGGGDWVLDSTTDINHFYGPNLKSNSPICSTNLSTCTAWADTNGYTYVSLVSQDTFINYCCYANNTGIKSEYPFNSAQHYVKSVTSSYY